MQVQLYVVNCKINALREGNVVLVRDPERVLFPME